MCVCVVCVVNYDTLVLLAADTGTRRQSGDRERESQGAREARARENKRHGDYGEAMVRVQGRQMGSNGMKRCKVATTKLSLSLIKERMYFFLSLLALEEKTVKRDMRCHQSLLFSSLVDYPSPTMLRGLMQNDAHSILLSPADCLHPGVLVQKHPGLVSSTHPIGPISPINSIFHSASRTGSTKTAPSSC